jgi:hypothetical protein
MTFENMPYMFEYAPGKMFNMKKLITIEINEHDPSSYLYGFSGPTVINISKSAHERFMRILKHEMIKEE